MVSTSGTNGFFIKSIAPRESPFTSVSSFSSAVRKTTGIRSSPLAEFFCYAFALFLSRGLSFLLSAAENNYRSSSRYRKQQHEYRPGTVITCFGGCFLRRERHILRRSVTALLRGRASVSIAVLLFIGFSYYCTYRLSTKQKNVDSTSTCSQLRSSDDPYQ